MSSLLQGQTLQGLSLQTNPAMNPATQEEPRKGGQRSTLLSKEKWSQGPAAVRSQIPQTCTSRAIWPFDSVGCFRATLLPRTIRIISAFLM